MSAFIAVIWISHALNDLLPFLFSLSSVLRSSEQRQFTCCQDLPTLRSSKQEDPSTKDNYYLLYANRMQKTYGARVIRLLGSFSLHVNSK